MKPLLGCRNKKPYASLREARKVAEDRPGNSWAYECYGGGTTHWHLTSHPLADGMARPAAGDSALAAAQARAADLALSKLPKDAQPEQIDKVLSGISDNLLKQKYTVDPGAFRFNKDVPAIGLPDVKEPRSIRIPMKDIPPDRQNALRGALKQAGVPVTEQAIEELEAKSRLKRSGVQ